MILDPPKPRRRPLRRLFWPLAITVFAVVAIAVAGAGRDTRADLDYLDQIQTQAVELSTAADAFRDVASRLTLVDRVEFVEAIDALRAELGRGQELVATGPPSEPLIAVNELYRVTLEAWSAGVGGFGSGILLAADQPTDIAVIDQVSDALAEIRAGDLLYLSLVAEMSQQDVPEPVAPMPAVILMPGEGSLASLSRAYVEAARAPTARLGLRPGLGLAQITSDPNWVVDPDDQVIIPATDTVTFTVVVTNTGNVASGEERLALTLTGGPVELGQEAVVNPLEPGSQTAIVLEPFPVEPGLLYEVRASLEMTGIDADFEDNDLSVVFLVGVGVPDEGGEETQ